MTWFTYPDETSPRAYKIPYTKKTHKKLREAAGGRKKGIKTYVEIKKKQPGKSNQQKIDDNIRFKLVKPQDIIPKE